MRQLSRPPAPSVSPASVARSRAAARAWREGPAYRHVAAAFDGLADRAAGVEAAAVAHRAVRLFRDTGWLDGLIAPLIDALAEDPWFEPPFRAQRDALRCGAILFESPVVAISVSVSSAERLRALPPPASLVFSGRLGVTCYPRAGGARLRRWAAPPVPAVCVAAAMGRCRALADRRLGDGAIVRHDGRVRAQAIADATADVVALTATVRVGADPVAREYDAASGAFLRMATTDEGAARAQVLLSLLRASGAAGADPCFDAATRDGAFFLRWSAMRDWLARDWRAALERLAEMAADDPHPEVRAAAGAMLDRLAGETARHAA